MLPAPSPDGTAFAPNVESVGAFDRALLSLINDPRDLPFVHLILQCTALALVGIGLFFVQTPYFWLIALAYWAAWGFGLVDRFTLMLHCTSHRILFKVEHKWMNKIIPWFLCPFFGQTPETYFAHHMGMHHPENNLHGDLSSTMKYQRDSLIHWLRYFGRFFFGCSIELPLYFWKKGQRGMAARAFFGELSFLIPVALLAIFVNAPATFVVFVVPFCTIRFLMMAGNWGQHAFVELSDGGNAYQNSCTCINVRYNRRAFNDGYHIHHHVKARCHWSEYPQELVDNVAEYAKNDAVVFEGIDFFMVWAYLMTKRWNTLAKHFVRLPGAPDRTDEEVIAFLKYRVAQNQDAQRAEFLKAA